MRATQFTHTKSTWVCEPCDTLGMSGKEMLDHLKNVHGYEAKGNKCHQQMLSHLDGEGYSISEYKVTVPASKGPVVLYNFVTLTT